MPSGTIQNAYRISRLVVLPDFQGLSIGIKILNYFGSLYSTDNKKLYIKTSNPSLFKGMEYNKEYWKLILEQNDVEKVKRRNQNEINKGNDNGMKLYKESITKSYKYIGEKSQDDLSIIKFKSEVYKDVAQNQISIFDILNQ